MITREISLLFVILVVNEGISYGAPYQIISNISYVLIKGEVMGNLIYEIEKKGDIAIVTMTLNVVLVDDNEELKKTLISLLDEGSKNIILDLTKTTYISSLILGTLVFILKRAKEAGGNFVICNMNDKIKEVFAMTNLDKVFDIFNNKQAALEQITKQ